MVDPVVPVVCADVVRDNGSVVVWLDAVVPGDVEELDSEPVRMK